MEKAWDLKDLGNRAKAKILPIAALLAGDVIDWSADSLAKSENTYVKIIGGVVRATKEPIMQEINKNITKAQSLEAMSVAGAETAAVDMQQAGQAQV